MRPSSSATMPNTLGSVMRLVVRLVITSIEVKIGVNPCCWWRRPNASKQISAQLGASDRRACLISELIATTPDASTLPDGPAKTKGPSRLIPSSAFSTCADRWTMCGLPFLVRAGDRPDCLPEVQFIPLKLRGLFTSLAGKGEEFHESRVTSFKGPRPQNDTAKLFVGQ